MSVVQVVFHARRALEEHSRRLIRGLAPLRDALAKARAAQALAIQIRELPEKVFGAPDSPLRAFWKLHASQLSEAEYEQALSRLEEGLRSGWKVRQPHVKEGLREEGNRREAKRLALMEGIFLALQVRGVPQHIRVGRAWIKDRDGQRALVVPVTLPIPFYVRWLQPRAYREAAGFFGPLPESQHDADPEQQVDRKTERDVDTLLEYGTLTPSHDWVDLLMVVADRSPDCLAVLEHATPRRREILEAVLKHLPGDTIPDAKKLAADEKDTSVGNIDVVLSRLRTAL